MTFAVRGFARSDTKIVDRLEAVALSFVRGYHAALNRPDPVALCATLNHFDPVHRGFGYEGAGMALELLDRLTPWRRNRLSAFLSGPAQAHTYMVTIGAGWAWARLPLRVASQLQRLDPVTGWLALDGFGFHEGFFHTQASIHQFAVPRRIRGDSARRAFDTGLGRSLWFVFGADVDHIANRIQLFEARRRPELWSGVGLACSYAGGASDVSIDRLCTLAGSHRADLAQGAAFAAKARHRAGTFAAHTQNAVGRICRTPPELAAKLCDSALAKVRSQAAGTTGPTAFESWREHIRGSLESTLQAQEECL